MLRRESLKKLAAIIAASPLLQSRLLALPDGTMLKRAIPSSGEKIPIVGVGTWQTFDVGESEAGREPLIKVLQILTEMGGSVIDSSPMYGRSEEVVGELAKKLGLTDHLFMATKVWTRGKEDGIRQMNESMRLMQTDTMDLMQIHNLVDWQTHLKTLREWKEEGKIRYIGITHYTDSAYDEMANIIKNNPIDFIQIDYSIDNTNSDNYLLPMAKDKGVAVLINRPYNGGSLFNHVKGKQIPEWVKEYDVNSWGQYFLKFILANDAVTCVIPGTDKPEYMRDNAQAGIGRMPDRADMVKMKKWFESI